MGAGSGGEPVLGAPGDAILRRPDQLVTRGRKAPHSDLEGVSLAHLALVRDRFQRLLERSAGDSPGESRALQLAVQQELVTRHVTLRRAGASGPRGATVFAPATSYSPFRVVIPLHQEK